jgi:hypothetical protein
VQPEGGKAVFGRGGSRLSESIEGQPGMRPWSETVSGERGALEGQLLCASVVCVDRGRVSRENLTSPNLPSPERSLRSSGPAPARATRMRYP